MSKGLHTIISRRPTRAYLGKHTCAVDSKVAPVMERFTNSSSSGDERDSSKVFPREHANLAARNFELTIPMVDLGREIGPIFPQTAEDLSKQIMMSLDPGNASTKPKVDGRPINFGTVIPGTIYRSSFPQKEDLDFLGTLKLKAIVSLVNHSFTPDFLAFMKTQGVRHFIIETQGTKKVEISREIMNSIMEVVLNQENHPLLIHCNHGKHRTGCVVSVIRHISGWDVEQILKEYTGFAHPKVRDCDISYIRQYQISSLLGLFNKDSPPCYPPTTLLRTKMLAMSTIAIAVLIIWTVTAFFWQDRS